MQVKWSFHFVLVLQTKNKMRRVFALSPVTMKTWTILIINVKVRLCSDENIKSSTINLMWYVVGSPVIIILKQTSKEF